MPIAANKLLCDGIERSLGTVHIGVLRGLQIEADTANSGRRHVIESRRGARFVDHDDTACPRAQPANGIDRTGVIRPIDAWCHNNDPVEVEPSLKIA